MTRIAGDRGAGWFYAPHGRGERLIAGGRLVLVASSVLAIWFDPSEPSKYVQTTYTLLAGFVLYAVWLAFLAWRAEVVLLRLRLATHVFDLAIFSALMYLTEGPTSPFFVYFVFSLVAATVRWQWRGTLWTALAALTIFLGLGAYAAEVLHDPEFELNRFIVRGVYLAVVAALLGYLGTYEQRLRDELSRLAAWSRAVPNDLETLVAEVLEQAARLLGVQRVLMVWEESEEPWVHVASWSEGEFRWTRQAPSGWDPLVPAPLAGADFLCQDGGADPPVVLYSTAAGLRRCHGAPVHPEFRARFDVRAVLSAVIVAESVNGRLFWLDKPGMTSDDLLLGEIVVRQVGASLDHFQLLKRLPQAAAAEERVQVVRALHDGVLQSLTAASLRLETARGLLLAGKPEAAGDCLIETQRLILAEQHDLRAFVEDLKPLTPAPDSKLGGRLEDLARRVEITLALPRSGAVDGH